MVWKSFRNAKKTKKKSLNIGQRFGPMARHSWIFTFSFVWFVFNLFLWLICHLTTYALQPDRIECVSLLRDCSTITRDDALLMTSSITSDFHTAEWFTDEFASFFNWSFFYLFFNTNILLEISHFQVLDILRVIHTIEIL